MRVRAIVCAGLIVAGAIISPAGAAPPRISVDNVDTLRVVTTYDLGGDPRFFTYALDRDGLYLTEFFTIFGTARLLRLDLDSGRIRWSIDLRCATGSPEAADGIVLFGQRACSLYPRPRVTAVHVSNGRTMWSAVADGALRAGPAVILWRAREFGAGERRVRLWAVHPATGRHLWTYQSPGEVSSVLLARAAPDAVYLEDDGDVVAIDPRTGEVRWRRAAPLDGVQTLWNADPSGPYFYRREGDRSFLEALDAETGSIRWRVAEPTGGLFDDGIAVVSVEASPGEYMVEARSAADGSILWARSLPALGAPQFFEAAGGVLYGTRLDFSQPRPVSLVAVDAGTGVELAEYPTVYNLVITTERILMDAGDGSFDVYEPTR